MGAIFLNVIVSPFLDVIIPLSISTSISSSFSTNLVMPMELQEEELQHL